MLLARTIERASPGPRVQGSGDKKRSRDVPSEPKAEPASENHISEPSALQNHIAEKNGSTSTVKVSWLPRLDLSPSSISIAFNLGIASREISQQRGEGQSLQKHLCRRSPSSIARWRSHSRSISKIYHTQSEIWLAKSNISIAFPSSFCHD